MIQSIYTSVSNADIVPCGKKGLHISTEPIPLLRNNYLGEYRTELEKAKVRKNLGIADDTVLEWGNITGHIEDNPDLAEAFSYKLPEHLKDIIKEDFTSVKGALSWAIEYISTFVTDTESIAWLREETANIRKSLQEKETTIYSHINNLSENVLNNINTITDILNSIQLINESITRLNESLASIDVDASILNWIKNATSNSIQLNENKLEVKISDSENNAINVDELGLHVLDLSEQVNTASLNIEGLQTDVKTILDNYVTKDDLGGDSFNFVDEDVFNQHVLQANTKFEEINSELNRTVKTGEDGHVDTLYVNTLSNQDGNIKIDKSLEVLSNIPLDVRFVVKNLDELHSLKPLICYAGMGVIVQNLASLYILREPANGIIDEEYIRDEEGINWKCPEDLVIEVLTQEEYDKKVEEDSINPHMFYYIHEEVVEEPKKEDYSTDEEYTQALDKWLRVLQQKYMSAVWGLEIEELVSSKASNTAIKSLESEIQRLSLLIDSLSGGSSGVNLRDLNLQVEENTLNLSNLTTQSETLQKDLNDLSVKVEYDYVTKESITIDNPDVNYIFVKKSDFDLYLVEHNQAIAESVNTKKVTTSEITLGDSILISKDSDLVFNEDKIALSSLVPIIEVIDSETFESKTDINDDTYYYIYNDSDRYVLDSEFTTYKSSQNTTVTTLSESINKNITSIGELNNLATENKNTLVLAINELVSKINDLNVELQELKNQISNS